MNLIKQAIQTLKENQAVPLGTSFTILGGISSGMESSYIKVSLDNDKYVDVDLVTDALMPAGTVINVMFYRGDILLDTATATMGAKGAAGTFTNRLTSDYIQKATHCVPECKLKQAAGTTYNASVFVTALKIEDSIDLAGITALASSAVFTIGAEAANVINVGIQFKDFMGAALAAETPIEFYVSSDAAGDTPVAVNDTLAIGTDGTILEVFTAKQSGIAKTESDGHIDFDITDASGAVNHYLNIILPDRILSSGVIAFT